MSIYNTIIGGSNPAKDCTATSGDILSGKTAAVGKEIVSGSMINRSTIDNDGIGMNETYNTLPANPNDVNVQQNVNTDGITRLSLQPPAGYYNGWVYVSATSTKVASAIGLRNDILAADQTVLGVTGTYTSDATATAADIAKGKTAYVNGAKLTGTLIPAPNEFAIFNQLQNTYYGKHVAKIGNNIVACSYDSDGSYAHFIDGNTFQCTDTAITYANYCLSSNNANSLMLCKNQNSSSYISLRKTSDYGRTWATTNVPMSTEYGEILTNGSSFVFLGYTNYSNRTLKGAYITNNLGASWSGVSPKLSSASTYFSGDKDTGYYYCLENFNSTSDTTISYYVNIYRSTDFNNWELWLSNVHLGNKSTTLKSTQYHHAMGIKTLNNTICIYRLDYYRSSSGAGSSSFVIQYSKNNGSSWGTFGSAGNTSVYERPSQYLQLEEINGNLYCYGEYHYKSSNSGTLQKLSTSNAVTSVSMGEYTGDFPIGFCALNGYLVFFYTNMCIRLINNIL